MDEIFQQMQELSEEMINLNGVDKVIDPDAETEELRRNYRTEVMKWEMC